MILDPAFIQACAPSVAVETTQAIIAQESAGNPFAVNVNGPRVNGLRAVTTLGEAVTRVERAMAAGHTADIGLMQINSQHLVHYNLTVRQAFEPCINLSVGADIITQNYRSAVARFGEGQGALMVALSLYNTGDMRVGFENGYVAQFYGPHANVTHRWKPSRSDLDADPNVFVREPKP